MRRTLTLRIGGMPADLNSDALILFNYTAERMDSPAAVKNSYSQQVTLPGTPGNAALFGRFWRADRRTVPDATRQTGVYFDALRRTPFEILAGGGEILERGYCKLDSVTRRGDLVTGYAVTLYGGLGSFYYSLAYRDGGDGKKTLADLAYVTGSANELDFDINAAAVSDAWLRLRTQEQGAARWDIINFAPTYGGLPEGTFDASKALFKPGTAGLPTEVDGKKPAAGGWSLCDLGADRTEMEVKDFRSYLQRPVLSVKKFIEACCNPANNGGWAVRLDPAFFNANNPYYSKAWMTLPRLDSLTLPAEHRGGSLELSGPAVTAEMTPASTRSALGQVANAAFKVELFAEPRMTLTEDAGSRPLYWNSTFRTEGSQAHTAHIRHGLFLQLVIRDVDNNPLAVSKSVLFHSTDYNGDALTAEEFATAAGYTPVTVGGEAPGYDSVLGWFTSNGTAASWHGGRAALSVEGSLIGAEDATVELIATPVRADYLDLGTPITYPWMTLWGSRGGALENEPVTFVAASVPVDVTTARYSADTLTEVHTGAHITKAVLLSTDKTPADYLFSYCKLFGLKFLTDRASNTVSILSRGTFYTGERTDLEGRIDRAQDVQTVPYAVAAKWYEFGLETAGAYADYYRKIRGRVFGTQRVNTGFEFDANTVGVLDGSAFRGAVEVMEQSKLFCNPVRTVEGVDYPMPAVFLAGGCKYSLYDGDGSADFDTGSNANSIDYMNEIYRGYDAVSRVQMHGEDGKAIDGAGVLLFFRGFQSGGGAMSRFALTDDSSIMASLNGGTPCWILEAGDTYQPFPLFGRYLWDDATVADSWDLGRPAELDIPGATYPAGTEIYSRFWAAFMADRYHRDTRVVTAWVDLRGMYVGEPLMRRFFKFDGALWALNKIIDHDITAGHLTKCEFVKVEAPEADRPHGDVLEEFPDAVLERRGAISILAEAALVTTLGEYTDTPIDVTITATVQPKALLSSAVENAALYLSADYVDGPSYLADRHYRNAIMFQAELIDRDSADPVAVSDVVCFTSDVPGGTNPAPADYRGREPVTVGGQPAVFRNYEGHFTVDGLEALFDKAGSVSFNATLQAGKYYTIRIRTWQNQYNWTDSIPEILMDQLALYTNQRTGDGVYLNGLDLLVTGYQMRRAE